MSASDLCHQSDLCRHVWLCVVRGQTVSILTQTLAASSRRQRLPSSVQRLPVTVQVCQGRSSLGLPSQLPGPDVCWQPSMITFHPSVSSRGVTRHNNSSGSGSSAVLPLICPGPRKVNKLTLKVHRYQRTFFVLRTEARVVSVLSRSNTRLFFLFTWTLQGHNHI